MSWRAAAKYSLMDSSPVSRSLVRSQGPLECVRPGDHPPFVHQIEAGVVPADLGDDERLEQRQRVHHRAHVRGRLEDHAVDQPERQFDALVDAALAVGEERQALGLLGQVVLQDRADLVEFALQDVLLRPWRAPAPW